MAINFRCRQLDLHGVGWYTTSVSVTTKPGTEVVNSRFTMTDFALRFAVVALIDLQAES